MGKMTLEKLLNILCEKGWKPFGESRINEINRAEQYAGNWNWCCWGSKDAIQRRKSTRQLVSKESGLWQFVCENEMLDEDKCWFSDYRRHNWMKDHGDGDKFIFYNTEEYEYRVIEASLKNEDELEQFLLDNIKVE